MIKIGSSRIRVGKVVVYTLLCMLVVANVFPFYSAVTTAFKPRGDILKVPPDVFPSPPTLEHFRNLLVARHSESGTLSFGIWYLNSVRQVVIAVPVTVFFASLGGFIFAKLAFWGKDILFMGLLATMMLPFIVLMIPMVMIAGGLGVADTTWGLVLPFVVQPFAIYLVRQHMETIPDDLMDAARMDGATNWQIYTQMMLPLSKTVLSAVAIFYFLHNWNNLLWPMVTLYHEENYTLPVGVASFAGEYVQDFGRATAAAVLMMLPTVVVFLIFQRGITEGIALTGLKG